MTSHRYCYFALHALKKNYTCHLLAQLKNPNSLPFVVDFINRFAPLRPTFEKLFTGTNVGRRAQKIGAGRKTVYEINPWTIWQCETISDKHFKEIWKPALSINWTVHLTIYRLKSWFSSLLIQLFFCTT